MSNTLPAGVLPRGRGHHGVTGVPSSRHVDTDARPGIRGGPPAVALPASWAIRRCNCSITAIVGRSGSGQFASSSLSCRPSRMSFAFREAAAL